MFYLILVFSMIAAAHILLNWLLIERYAIYINHTMETVIAALLYTSVIILFWYTKQISVKEAGIIIVVWPFIRWIVHDLFLNLMRGKPIFYYGTGPNKAFTDTFLDFFVQRKVPVWLIKGTILSIFLLIALLIFKTF